MKRDETDGHHQRAGGWVTTDLPMIDFLKRRSDGSVRPSMATMATGSFSLAFGDAGWSKGHSIDAEG